MQVRALKAIMLSLSLLTLGTASGGAQAPSPPRAEARSPLSEIAAGISKWFTRVTGTEPKRNREGSFPPLPRPRPADFTSAPVAPNMRPSKSAAATSPSNGQPPKPSELTTATVAPNNKPSVLTAAPASSKKKPPPVLIND